MLCFHLSAGRCRLPSGGRTAGRQVKCRIGMATGAAFFGLPVRGGEGRITSACLWNKPSGRKLPLRSWPEAHGWRSRAAGARSENEISLRGRRSDPYSCCRPMICARTLYLPPLLVPGCLPDAPCPAAIGLAERCRRQLDHFPGRQKADGFFHSQDGEWDSNGQVLWIYNRFRSLTGGDYNPEWLNPVSRGGDG